MGGIVNRRFASMRITAVILFQIGLPLFGAALIQVGLQSANTYLMGHVGTDALYLVALYIPFSFFVLAVAEAVAITNQVLVARKVGQQKLTEVMRPTFTFIVIGTLCVTFLALAVWFGRELLGGFLEIHPDNRERFARFVTLMLLSSAAMLPGWVLDSTLRGMGKTAKAFILLLGYGATYVLVAFYLVHSKQMAEEALPIASFAASGILLLATLLVLRRERLLPPLPAFLRFNVEAPIMLRYVGLPIFLSHLLLFGSTFFYQRILAPFGEEVIAGFGVAFRIQMLVILPALSLGEAVSILMNQRMAGKQFAGAFEVFKVGLAQVFLLYLVLTVVVVAGHEAMIAFFTPSGFVAAEAARYLSTVSPSYCWMGMLLMTLLILEQTDNGFRAFAMNVLYFALVIGVGGYLAQSQQSPSAFYNTVLGFNFLGALVVAWEYLRQARKFGELASIPTAVPHLA